MTTSLLGDAITRGVGSLLWLAALAGFIAVAVGIMGQSAWWRMFAIGSSVISLVAWAHFSDKNPTRPAISAGLFDVVYRWAIDPKGN